VAGGRQARAGRRGLAEELDEAFALRFGGSPREWIVPVTWGHAVPRESAFWRTGFFANQNSACKLRARFTIDEVSRHFGVVDDLEGA
jgi:hypothetical protein